MSYAKQFFRALANTQTALAETSRQLRFSAQSPEKTARRYEQAAAYYYLLGNNKKYKSLLADAALQYFNLANNEDRHYGTSFEKGLWLLFELDQRTEFDKMLGSNRTTDVMMDRAASHAMAHNTLWPHHPSSWGFTDTVYVGLTLLATSEPSKLLTFVLAQGARLQKWGFEPDISDTLYPIVKDWINAANGAIKKLENTATTKLRNQLRTTGHIPSIPRVRTHAEAIESVFILSRLTKIPARSILNILLNPEAHAGSVAYAQLRQHANPKTLTAIATHHPRPPLRDFQRRWLDVTKRR